MVKFFLITILALKSLSGFAQLALDPIVYNKDKQNSIKENFLLENPHVELPDNWTTVNINYLTNRNFKNISISNETRFIDNLEAVGKYYIIHQIIDTLNNKNCYSASSAFGITIRPTGKNFVSKIKYLNEIISLDKGRIFFLPPINDMYLIYENKIYIVELDGLYEFKKYMKKTYKTRKVFQNKFKVTMD